MDRVQLYWNCGEEGSGHTSSLFLSLFSSFGLCHSLCTMVFHSFGVEFPCIEVTLLHTSVLCFPLIFSKGVMGRLIRKDVVVWWFIKGLPSSVLIYVTPFCYFLIFKTTITFLPLRCGDLRDS